MSPYGARPAETSIEYRHHRALQVFHTAAERFGGLLERLWLSVNRAALRGLSRLMHERPRTRRPINFCGGRQIARLRASLRANVGQRLDSFEHDRSRYFSRRWRDSDHRLNQTIWHVRTRAIDGLRREGLRRDGLRRDGLSRDGLSRNSRNTRGNSGGRQRRRVAIDSSLIGAIRRRIGFDQSQMGLIRNIDGQPRIGCRAEPAHRSLRIVGPNSVHGAAIALRVSQPFLDHARQRLAVGRAGEMRGVIYRTHANNHGRSGLTFKFHDRNRAVNRTARATTRHQRVGTGQSDRQGRACSQYRSAASSRKPDASCSDPTFQSAEIDRFQNTPSPAGVPAPASVMRRCHPISVGLRRTFRAFRPGTKNPRLAAPRAFRPAPRRGVGRRQQKTTSRPVSRVLFGELPLRDGHSSGTHVAMRLKQSTRVAGLKMGSTARVNPPVRPPLFDLAPGGVCPAANVTARAVRSYRTVSPLPRQSCRSSDGGRFVFCGTVPRVAPGGR